MKPIKIWEKGKIAWYASKADQAYWDSLWASQISTDYFARYRQGELDEYAPFFEKHLKKSDRIIEAGCGTGRFVVALKARAYDNVQGIDWGKPTIEKVKALFPDLPVEVGDATKIEVDDGYYDAYISLGVVEHRRAGPEPFLYEAYRVLKPGGVMIISVPYVNPLRNLKKTLGSYRDRNIPGLDFYQFAYGKEEFTHLLNTAGFEVIIAQGISGLYGIKEEIPLLATLFNHLPGGWRIEQSLRKWAYLNKFGHMLIFVCEKQGINN